MWWLAVFRRFILRWRTWSRRSSILEALRTGLLRSRTGERTLLAHEVAVKVIANITRTSAGPDYEEVIELGTKYWDSVLAGRPDPAAKEAADRALSQLLGCRAEVSGRKHTWREKILRAFL